MNWMRVKVPPSTCASVLTVSVLARPGTPSSSTWPPASSATSRRSSIASCPTITRLISCSASSSTSRGSSRRGTRLVGGRSSGIGSSSVSLSIVSDQAAEPAQRQRRAGRAAGRGRRPRTPPSPGASRRGGRAASRAARRRRRGRRSCAAVKVLPPEARAICRERLRVRRDALGSAARRLCRARWIVPCGRCRARRCRSGSAVSPPAAPRRPGRGRTSRCRRRSARSRRAGVCRPRSGTLRSAVVAVAIASPVAVPPLTAMRSIAARTSARSRVGLCSTTRGLLKASTPTFTPLGTLVDERARRALGGDQPARLDVGRQHRAGDVGREHDRRALDRHRDRALRPRGREHEQREREREGEHRQVPAPARPARRDRRQQPRRRERRGGASAARAAAGRTRRAAAAARAARAGRGARRSVTGCARVACRASRAASSVRPSRSTSIVDLCRPACRRLSPARRPRGPATDWPSICLIDVASADAGVGGGPAGDDGLRPRRRRGSWRRRASS